MKVGIFYRNFKTLPGVSHIGLGVSAENVALVLSSAGIDTSIHTLDSDLDFLPLLKKQSFTHVIISALWVRTGVIDELCKIFPKTIFVINCHSNVGFLQSEPPAIKLFRDQLKLQNKHDNFFMSGNSLKFVNFIRKGYQQDCLYLPNMYYLGNVQSPSWFYSKKQTYSWHYNPSFNAQKDALNIGMFGAIRVQKNFPSGAAAAIQIGVELNKPVNLFINSGRYDTSDTQRLITAIKELTKDVPNFSLIEIPWDAWDNFNMVVATMRILFQPSYSESFNLVTCDGIKNHVPSMVSPAINWAPKSWQADPDNIDDMVRVAINVLNDKMAPKKGFRALTKHNSRSLKVWKEFLTVSSM